MPHPRLCRTRLRRPEATHHASRVKRRAVIPIVASANTTQLSGAKKARRLTRRRISGAVVRCSTEIERQVLRMKFVTFTHGGRTAAGLLLAAGVLPLAQAAVAGGETLDCSSVLAIIRAGEPGLAACRRLGQRAASDVRLLVPLAQAELQAPLPALVRNAFCVGRNYVDHVKEGAAARNADVKLPEAPQFFTKATHCLVGPGAEVRLDRKVTRRLDYEVELTLIIGRGGRDIARASAFDHIFGYTIAN